MEQSIATKKVYLNKKKEGHFTCGHCGKAHTLRARDSAAPIAKGVDCSCTSVTDVHLEQRQHFRKDVEFIGTFEKIYPDSSEMGKIIAENGVVRFVNGLSVGIEFQHLSEHTKKLIGFYLMQFAAAPIPSSKQKIAGTSNTRESSDSRLVSNPFGIAVDKIPVSLKGDLTSFGLHAIPKNPGS